MNRSIFLQTRNKINTKSTIKDLQVNFGPQHPAAHGVLRMILEIRGEVITDSDPHIGLLHRGTEKLMEDKMYVHSLPYFDRLDYVSMLMQEHAYCLAIENMVLDHKNMSTSHVIRTLYDELTRILNHLLALACHALDVGSMSPIFWGFEEREKIMEFYERVSGARMHAALYRPSSQLDNHISIYLLEDISLFITNASTTLTEINALLLYNKIWKQRLVGVGAISASNARLLGLTGVLGRSCGLKNDIRLKGDLNYGVYNRINFNSYLGQHGDSYDRYVMRISEMVQSLRLINICCCTLLTELPISEKLISTKHSVAVNHPYKNMEALIKHFKYWSEGITLKTNITYTSVESAKGEFGVTLLADGTNKPYRCKIRSPSYYSLQALPYMVKGSLLADLITLIGTIDIVFGEVDR